MSLHARWQNNGAGDTVVFLHGFMGSSADWDGLTERLGKTFNYLYVDLPGHGRSPLGAAGDFKETSEQITETLDAFELTAVHLLGYSMGGRLALYWALQYPRRVQTLVLESASPGLRNATERNERKLAEEKIAEKLQNDFKGFLTDWYNQPLFAGISRRAGFPQLLKRRLRNEPQKLAAIVRQLSVAVQPGLWPRLPELSCPVLLVCGAQDKKYVRISRQMRQINPAFERQVIPDCGHNTHFEQPDDFSRIVRDFLRKHAR